MWFSTHAPLDIKATASQIFVDTNLEYANETISITIGDIWYVWINVSKTQVIYCSLFSDEVNSPIINFLGQHFKLKMTLKCLLGKP
jgi:hypothetical protein